MECPHKDRKTNLCVCVWMWMLYLFHGLEEIIDFGTTAASYNFWVEADIDPETLDQTQYWTQLDTLIRSCDVQQN